MTGGGGGSKKKAEAARTLLGRRRFHHVVLACAADVFLHSFNMVAPSLESVLGGFGLHQFDLVRVLHVLRADLGLPLKVRQRLTALEDGAFEQELWQSASPLLHTDAYRAHMGQELVNV